MKRMQQRTSLWPEPCMLTSCRRSVPAEGRVYCSEECCKIDQALYWLDDYDVSNWLTVGES